MPTEHHFADPADAAADLAGTIAAHLNEVIAARDEATLALSGGRAPCAMLMALCDQSVAWSKVIVTLADERCVANDNADSNERLIRATLVRIGSAAKEAVYRPARDTATIKVGISTI